MRHRPLDRTARAALRRPVPGRLPPPRVRARWVAIPLLLVVLWLSGCSFGEGDRTERRSVEAEPPSVAGVEVYPVPRAVAEVCRSTQRKARIPILCPTRLPRPVRDSAGSSALPLDALTAFAWDSSGIDFSYSAETGRRRLDRPERFFHLDVIEQDQPLPPGARPARLGGKAGLLAPASSGDYASESYFANHWRFFWTERGVDYAATLHDFGPGTKPLLSRLIRDLRPANALPRRPRAQGGVATFEVPVPGPVSVAVNEEEVWVAGQGNRSATGRWLARIDPDTGRASGRRIRILGGGGTSALWLDGSVWVAHRGAPGAPGLQRVDRRNHLLSAPVDVRRELVALARTARSLWLLDYGAWPAAPTRRGGFVLKTNRAASRVVARIPVGRAPAAIARGDGDLWVTNNLDDTVTRIDPQTSRVVETIPVGRAPVGVTYGYGAIWVASNKHNTVSRIDPGKERVVDTIPVGRGARGIQAGEGGIWVTNELDDTVSKIEPRTNRVVKTVRVGAGPEGIAIGAGAVWVANKLDQTVTRIDP
jgi:YVTN family beta-propeller protein